MVGSLQVVLGNEVLNLSARLLTILRVIFNDKHDIVWYFPKSLYGVTR